MDFDVLLDLVVQKKASDLFITAGVAPSIKVNGVIMPVGKTSLSAEKARQLVENVMNEEQIKEFHSTRELNFAIGRPGVGRFRVSAFYQRNEVGMVLRRIESKIPTIEELSLPPVLNDLAMTKRGIIIFVGATGAGKSTSLAAMIGYRNRNSKGHIISVEDPIEFIHRHEAITFAETGHLVLATLHANNANQALDRIQHFFPTERQNQLWMDLSLNLKAMVAQQLIPLADGSGRCAAIEILINTPLVGDLIRKGEVHKLKELMARSTV